MARARRRTNPLANSNKLWALPVHRDGTSCIQLTKLVKTCHWHQNEGLAPFWNTIIYGASMWRPKFQGRRHGTMVPDNSSQRGNNGRSTAIPVEFNDIICQGQTLQHGVLVGANAASYGRERYGIFGSNLINCNCIHTMIIVYWIYMTQYARFCLEPIDPNRSWLGSEGSTAKRQARLGLGLEVSAMGSARAR